jgi:hypothetical protein
MAYTNKYKITVATKSNTISYVYLLEDGYVGDLIEYPATSISLQYLPQSDDVFEPIMVSQLSLSIDITDDEINMPNFTTLNDRKYLVKVYNESTLEWQGWALSDNVNISYTTGRKELSFNAIDGLGMLEKIKFPVGSSFYLTDLQSCLTYLIISLNQIQFPTSLNIISGISYYSDSMNNRTAATSNEPLIQSYLRLITFLDDNSEAFDCLEIIKEICKAFGAKIFQANCKWYIITPNEFAQASYYFTEYNPSTGVVASGTKSFTGNIEPFTGNISGLYYVNNSQVKILRKGYNKVRLSKNINYPSNFITNANLLIYTGNDAFGWVEAITGTNSFLFVKVYEETGFNSFILFSGNTGTANVYPLNIPALNFNDIASLSFDISNLPTNTTIPKLCIVYITLTNGTDTYHIDSTSRWVSSGTDYYFVALETQVNQINSVKNISLELPPAPISGTLNIVFSSDTTTYDWVELSNFKLDVSQLFKSVLTESYITDSEEYVYDADLKIGFNYTIEGKFYYRGALSDSEGNSLQNWYRYEYPTDIYNSLSELVIKQYSNILEKNIINIDSTFFGLINTSGSLNASMRLTSDDADAINTVEGLKYLLGNSTLDIINSEVQSTLLEINDANIETTLVTTYEDTNPARIFGQRRSLGQTTFIAALTAPLTSNLLYRSGSTYYIDRNLAHTFNGASLYYRILGQNLVQTNVNRINSSGVIIPI